MGRLTGKRTIVILEKKVAKFYGEKGETSSVGKIDHVVDYLVCVRLAFVYIFLNHMLFLT